MKTGKVNLDIDGTEEKLHEQVLVATVVSSWELEKFENEVKQR